VHVGAQHAVLGDPAELVEVQRRPALDKVTSEGAFLPGRLPVGVGIQPPDLGQPGMVVREQVLTELAGHGRPLSW
jgi:hypothetical protein